MLGKLFYLAYPTFRDLPQLNFGNNFGWWRELTIANLYIIERTGKSIRIEYGINSVNVIIQ